MYKPKYFKTYELVDKETYELLGEQSLNLFPEQLLKDIDSLRENLGKATINDWYWGGKYSQRGFRSANSDTGGLTSQHREAKAFDLIFEDYSAEEVRQHIIKNKHLYPSINRVEGEVSWNHIDAHSAYGDVRIYVFNP